MTKKITVQQAIVWKPALFKKTMELDNGRRKYGWIEEGFLNEQLYFELYYDNALSQIIVRDVVKNETEVVESNSAGMRWAGMRLPKEVKELDIFNMIKEVSDLDKRNNRLSKLVKLMEELGELSAEALKSIGYKKTDELPAEIFAKEVEESIDVLLMAVDIVNSYQLTESEIRIIVTKKLEKWKTKHLEL